MTREQKEKVAREYGISLYSDSNDTDVKDLLFEVLAKLIEIENKLKRPRDER